MPDAGQTRYTVRMAASTNDLTACQRLRHRAFFGGTGLDRDAFDPLCTHLMVVERTTTRLIATARVALYPRGAGIVRSYTAESYDMHGLAQQSGPLAEVGRFCLAPDAVDGDALRVAWAALTRFVDRHNVQTLFGCTSFAGTDPAPYAAALATLQARHLGAAGLRPLVKADDAVPLSGFTGDARRGVAQMPPLLATYLKMGGWVGDHLVVDHAMNTLHVFTALQIADVPPARARSLRAYAKMIAPL